MSVDTIVAQATPPGRSAVALIRLSGEAAAGIVARLAGQKTADVARVWSDRRSRLVTLRCPRTGECLDRALVTFFPAPGSYTGETVVEISTHGGYGVPPSVVEACVALGARPARAGEFTQRAYLHGKVDLTQAEAVRDLIESPSSRGRVVALHQMERGLGARISALRGELVGLAALLVQHIDFPEEDDAPTPLDVVGNRARGVARALSRLLATAPAGEALREGAVTVLAGPPNSGKSSLFNALLGVERALVTEIPGTTRDAIEAVVEIDGFPFRLIDTAGLRAGTDTVERLGIEVSRRYLATADVVLYCREVRSSGSGRVGALGGANGGRGSDRTGEEFLATVTSQVVKVRTKSDRLRAGEIGPEGEVLVSSKSGEGLDKLKAVLRDTVFGGVVDNRVETPVVTVKRQARHMEAALRELHRFADALEAGVPPEVASAHLKAAETALEEVLGVVTSDDVLERVFREFCIGK